MSRTTTMAVYMVWLPLAAYAFVFPNGPPPEPNLSRVASYRHKKSWEILTPELEPQQPLHEWWQDNWGRVAILSCAMVYGTNFAMVKSLDHVVAPSLSASLRFGLAATAATPILLKQRQSLQEHRLLSGAVEVGVVNAIGYVAQAVGLERVDASLSAFVCSLVVVVVPALDAFLLRRATPLSTWLGCCLAAVGVALLALDPNPMAGASPQPVTAVAALATGLQPFLFGYGFWRTEQLLSTALPQGDGRSTTVEVSLACAAAQLAAVKAAADIWLCADLVEGTIPHSIPDICAQLNKPDVLPAVIWTGLVTTFATVLVETVALSKISAKETSLLFTTEPLWGAAFATFTLDEHLGAAATLGGLLIILACVLTVLANNPATDETAAIIDVLDYDM